MRLGYSINSTHPLEDSPPDVASRLVELAYVASNAGFDSVQAGDYVAAVRRDLQRPDAGALTAVFVDEAVIRPMNGDHALETLACCGEAADRLAD